MGNKVSFATAGLGLTAIVFSAASANAVLLTIPTTTVNGTDVFSGPSFTVTSNFLGTDAISLNVSGTVDIIGGGFTTNAAGILTQPSNFSGFNVGDFLDSGTIPGAALTLGNSTLGFYQLFATNATNGLRSSNPPTNLSLTNVSLSSIFGSGLRTGTILQFRVFDSDNFNNSGAFTVSGSINETTTAVPEPFTIIGTLIGGTAAVRMRKKLKAEKA